MEPADKIVSFDVLSNHTATLWFGPATECGSVLSKYTSNQCWIINYKYK